MKFCFRTEQRLSPTHADVRAWFFGVFVLTCPGGFGALLAGHMILLRRQNLAPLGFALADFFGHDSPRRIILTSGRTRKKSLAFERAQRTESHEQKAQSDAVNQEYGQGNEDENHRRDLRKCYRYSCAAKD